MSPVAIPDVGPSAFAPLLDALRTAPTAPGTAITLKPRSEGLIGHIDAKAAAEKLAREVAKHGFRSLLCVPRRSFFFCVC